MDAAIMLGIIGLAAQLTVSSTQTSQDKYGYLPVCTGSHITASRVSGEFIILGHNHLGKSASVFTINATTPTPDSSKVSFQPHTQPNNSIEIKDNSPTSFDCGCEINATAKFNATIMTIPTSKSAAIWLKTGNSSKKLIERQASSVVSENTSHSPFTAYLKIKTSSSTESFLLLIEILSYGNITVRCIKGKEDKTKSQEHVIGVEQDQTSERPLTEGQLGTATVAGELVAGIVLLTIAVLVLLAAMLFWGRIYYTKYMEKNGTQKEKKSEYIPMKKLSHYEEMEDSETGYYRYSDPLDHRTTLMNSSQLALDKVHIVLHHPELTSAGTSPTKSSTMAGTRVTSPTSIPETSRHLAEIVVENLRNDEDEESDIYEEYSNVVVKNEDEEQHQREEALSEMLDEEQQYQHSPAQPTARMEPPVVIRVHRKESDNKKSCDVPIQISSQPDQSSLSDQYVYFNDKNLNVDCDPLLSRPFEHSKNLVDFVDNIGHSGQKSETEDSVLNKSASSLPEENQTYVNALMVQDFITTGDADIDRSDNVLATLINRTNNTANSEKPSEKTFINDQQVPSKDLDLKTCHLTSTRPLIRVQSQLDENPNLNKCGRGSNEQSVTDNDHSLETYGLASAKPLDCEQSATTNDTDLETYGLASEKPLDYEQSVTTNDPDLETYGLASAKTLDCEQLVTKNDPDFETYGLASAKPLDCEQSVTTNDPDLETYGLASAKPLDYEQSVTTNDDTDIELYSMASAKPLDYEQSVTTNDPDLETYGLASAKPLDCEQSVTTNDPDLETYSLASAKPLDCEQSVTTNVPLPVGFLINASNNPESGPDRHPAGSPECSNNEVKLKDLILQSPNNNSLLTTTSSSFSQRKNPLPDASAPQILDGGNSTTHRMPRSPSADSTPQPKRNIPTREDTEDNIYGNLVPSDTATTETAMKNTSPTPPNQNDVPNEENDDEVDANESEHVYESYSELVGCELEKFRADGNIRSWSESSPRCQDSSPERFDSEVCNTDGGLDLRTSNVYTDLEEED